MLQSEKNGGRTGGEFLPKGEELDFSPGCGAQPAALHAALDGDLGNGLPPATRQRGGPRGKHVVCGTASGTRR